jgi:hypothetical protein
LPDKQDLQAMAQRMVGTSGSGTLVVHCWQHMLCVDNLSFLTSLF